MYIFTLRPRKGFWFFGLRRPILRVSRDSPWDGEGNYIAEFVDAACERYLDLGKEFPVIYIGDVPEFLEEAPAVKKTRFIIREIQEGIKLWDAELCGDDTEKYLKAMELLTKYLPFMR